MIQDKAQSAGNGVSFSRSATPYWIIRVASLRASREAIVRCVAPLGKDVPLPARRALRFFMPSGAIASRLAEPIHITLTEYQALKIIVVGAGLQGLCSAQVLIERGHHLTVFEALDGVGLETSFANGGLITPSKCEPWNGPAAVSHLLSSIFKSSSAFVLRPRAIPSLLSWGIDFLKNSTRARRERSVEANFGLASYSQSMMREIQTRLGLEFAQSSRGLLNVYRAGEPVEEVRKQAEFLSRFGMRFEELATDDVIALEPALVHARELVRGAFYFPDDDSGDAHLFCQELLREILSGGATVRTATPVTRLALEKQAVIGVETDHGLTEADAVVIAAGNGSPALARPLGVSLPIRPAKGYSLTLNVGGIDELPRTPLIDETLHATITPMNGRLRMTSTVEFSGFDKRIDQGRIDDLFSLLEELYPRIASRIDRTNARPWAGLRPVSSDGRPFIGPGRVPGLYINSGHGPLGWTLGMGSARLLADLIEGRTPEIDARPFDAAR